MKAMKLSLEICRNHTFSFHYRYYNRIYKHTRQQRKSIANFDLLPTSCGQIVVGHKIQAIVT